MTVRLGFTGSQYGMQPMQAQMLFDHCMMLAPDELHHGMCIGADAVLDSMTYCFVGCTIHGHPPINTSKMAQDLSCSVVHPPKDYLVRNHDIVDATDVLFAAPKGPAELRSGTWSTVRYARKLGRPIMIFWPDGTIEVERQDLLQQLFRRDD